MVSELVLTDQERGIIHNMVSLISLQHHIVLFALNPQ